MQNYQGTLSCVRLPDRIWGAYFVDTPAWVFFSPQVTIRNGVQASDEDA